MLPQRTLMELKIAQRPSHRSYERLHELSSLQQWLDNDLQNHRPNCESKTIAQSQQILPDISTDTNNNISTQLFIDHQQSISLDPVGNFVLISRSEYNRFKPGNCMYLWHNTSSTI